jgi:tetratricopeptide (TPR) repeat protein
VKAFLSHSSKDREFVERLAAGLKAASIEPWLFEVDIPRNENFVARIEEGLTQCDVSLLVWSPDAAASAWTTEEWTAILARQVAEQRVRLGIILLRDSPLPELLRTRNYIDARTDPDAGVRETVKWLAQRESVQRLAGLKAPVYLPDYRPQDFVGREAYLERLGEAFSGGPGRFLLHGGPGTGKSMLALRFAWDAQKDFDAVVFQACGDRDIDTIGNELAERLPIEGRAQSTEARRKQAMEWLRGRQSLLVLDDVWKADVRLLEPGPPCSVLYTSRMASLAWVSPQQSVEVKSFQEDEAERVFHAYLDGTFGEEEVARHRDVLLGFANKVEMLPIAVAVAASLLRERSASRLERSVLRLRVEELNDGVQDVPQLFTKAIASRPERERNLLAACAMCMQEGFWLPLAARIAQMEEDDVEEAADRLVHASLLRVLGRTRQRFQLHAILREEVRAGSGPEIQGWRRKHAAALALVAGQWREQTPYLFFSEVLEARRFLESGQDFAGALELCAKEEKVWLEAGNRNALELCYCGEAEYLRNLGRLEEAIAVLQKQEAVCQESGNTDGLERGYLYRAEFLRELGRIEEAIEVLDRQEAAAMEIDNRLGLQTGYSVRVLALEDQGRLAEAIAVLGKLEGAATANDDKLQLANCYAKWGMIAGEQGDRRTEREKLTQAVVLFDELKMMPQRDAVQGLLSQVPAE